MNDYLNPLDSAFVLLDLPGSAMNIGAVIELDFGDVSNPQQRFEQIKLNIEKRLHEIPVLTQRLVRSPFDLTWPIMIPDRRFDIDHHVMRVALPFPGTSDQFDELVSRVLSTQLPSHRPLWQLLVIEGLADGRAAIVLKIHHALADGVSGAETFANLFDISPEVREPTATSGSAQPHAELSSTALLARGVRRVVQNPALGVWNIYRWLGRLREILVATAKALNARGRHQSTPGQPSLFEARRTSLNGAAGLEKEYHRISVPLSDVKRAAKARDASVTDVVISTTSGALSRLMRDRGEELARDLVAFVPINVRAQGGASDLGNQLSGMLVSLHTDISDPEVRLRAISTDSQSTVGAQRELRARLFQDIPRVLGPTLLSIGGKFISALGLFDRMPPIANLMISSVPGPPIPLWLSGHRVVSAAPVGPLFGPFSLNITVLGFGESLEFGLLGCAQRFEDLSSLRDYLHEEVLGLIASTAVEGLA